MKLILSVPIAVVIACASAGCGPKIRPSLSMEQQRGVRIPEDWPYRAKLAR